MTQSSRSYFPVRTAHSLRMRIVTIIVAIAVIVFLAGCGCLPAPGVADSPGVNILLLAETTQLAVLHYANPDLNEPVIPNSAPPPQSLPRDILINTTSTHQRFDTSFSTPYPHCGRERYDTADILAQFDRIQNKGDTPIYSLIVQNHDFSVDRRAFAQLQEDFPNYERLKLAYIHDTGYSELFISDGTGPVDPTTAPRWENKKDFIDRFIVDICAGNVATCKYMTVIEPGTTGRIVSTSFFAHNLGR